MKNKLKLLLPILLGSMLSVASNKPPVTPNECSYWTDDYELYLKDKYPEGKYCYRPTRPDFGGMPSGLLSDDEIARRLGINPDDLALPPFLQDNKAKLDREYEKQKAKYDNIRENYSTILESWNIPNLHIENTQEGFMYRLETMPKFVYFRDAAKKGGNPRSFDIIHTLEIPYNNVTSVEDMDGIGVYNFRDGTTIHRVNNDKSYITYDSTEESYTRYAPYIQYPDGTKKYIVGFIPRLQKENMNVEREKNYIDVSELDFSKENINEIDGGTYYFNSNPTTLFTQEGDNGRPYYTTDPNDINDKTPYVIYNDETMKYVIGEIPVVPGDGYESEPTTRPNKHPYENQPKQSNLIVSRGNVLDDGTMPITDPKSPIVDIYNGHKTTTTPTYTHFDGEEFDNADEAINYIKNVRQENGHSVKYIISEEQESKIRESINDGNTVIVDEEQDAVFSSNGNKLFDLKVMHEVLRESNEHESVEKNYIIFEESKFVEYDGNTEVDDTTDTITYRDSNNEIEAILYQTRTPENELWYTCNEENINDNTPYIIYPNTGIKKYVLSCVAKQFPNTRETTGTNSNNHVESSATQYRTTVNKQELQELYDKKDDVITSDKYINEMDDSKKQEYDNALIKAKQILDDGSATPDQVNSAKQNLENAYNNLTGVATNKDDLQSLVNEKEQEKAKHGYYNSESSIKQEYDDAISEAETILQKDNVTQREVNQAIQKITETKNKLTAPATNKDALNEEYNKKDIVIASYKYYNETDDVKKQSYDSATSNAIAILVKDTATQSEVDGAKERLINAYNELSGQPTDYTELNSLYNNYETEKAKAKYYNSTNDLKEAYDNYMKAARLYLDNKDTVNYPQADVDKLVKNINNALGRLNGEETNTNALQELVNEKDEIRASSKYTNETNEANKQEYDNAILEAEKLLGKDSASQTEVDALVDRINNAKGNLQGVDSTNINDFETIDKDDIDWYIEDVENVEVNNVEHTYTFANGDVVYNTNAKPVYDKENVDKEHSAYIIQNGTKKYIIGTIPVYPGEGKESELRETSTGNESEVDKQDKDDTSTTVEKNYIILEESKFAHYDGDVYINPDDDTVTFRDLNNDIEAIIYRTRTPENNEIYYYTINVDDINDNTPYIIYQATGVKKYVLGRISDLDIPTSNEPNKNEESRTQDGTTTNNEDTTTDSSGTSGETRTETPNSDSTENANGEEPNRQSGENTQNDGENKQDKPSETINEENKATTTSGSDVENGTPKGNTNEKVESSIDREDREDEEDVFMLEESVRIQYKTKKRLELSKFMLNQGSTNINYNDHIYVDGNITTMFTLNPNVNILVGGNYKHPVINVGGFASYAYTKGTNSLGLGVNTKLQVFDGNYLAYVKYKLDKETDNINHSIEVYNNIKWNFKPIKGLVVAPKLNLTYSHRFGAKYEDTQNEINIVDKGMNLVKARLGLDVRYDISKDLGVFGEFGLGAYYGNYNLALYKDTKFLEGLGESKVGVNYNVKVGTVHNVNGVKILPYVKVSGLDRSASASIGLNVGKSW